MPKMYPFFNFKEQIDIHELLGTFKELFLYLKEDDYSPESIEEINVDLNQELEKASKNSLVALKIPLLNITEIREELSLSDYIIYLIILETNLQGKFFDEENIYITQLTGVKSAQVGNSIIRLIKNDFVYYVDKFNQICYGKKPFTENQAKEYFDKHPEKLDDIIKPKVNNKRVLVINPEVLEYLSTEPKISTKEQRLEARKKARKNKIEADKKKRNLHYTLVNLNYKKNISNEMIKMSTDEKFRKKQPETLKDINEVLSEHKVSIEEVIEFIDNIKKK